MAFKLKPTRMTVSDLRPSLSYRVGIPDTGRTARHWVEIALSSQPTLFDPLNAADRNPGNFVTFQHRFAMPGPDAIIHVPPAALLALVGANRIYTGAALFADRTGGMPVSVIRPDQASVYVDASGFSGAGVRWRFGFSTRPAVGGEPPVQVGTHHLTWAGDTPQPGSASPQQHGQPLAGAGALAEGHNHMPQDQGFMHKGGYAAAMPTQPGQSGSQYTIGGATAGAPIDYDDGYGTPPPPLPPQGNGSGHVQPPANGIHPGAPSPGPLPQTGQFQPGINGQGLAPSTSGSPSYGNGNGNGNGNMPDYGNGAHVNGPSSGNVRISAPMPGHVAPGSDQPQPMPGANGGTQQTQPSLDVPTTPTNGSSPNVIPTNGGAPATQQGYGNHFAGPMEFVLPSFDSWTPWDVISTLVDAFRDYNSFTAGVPDTSKFPFSAIVAIRGSFRRKSNGEEAYGAGTGFYIGPNLVLTCAHNFAEDDEWQAAHSAELFAGLNNPGSNNPYDGFSLSNETITPSTAVTIHPTYLNGATAEIRRSHDLAVIRVANAAPNGQYFRIADFTPAQSVQVAVCGYGRASHAQGSSGSNWRKLLSPVQRDWNQHMDSDVVRGVVGNGEAFIYNAQTLAGCSGSPVFLAPQSNGGGDPAEAMPVIAVHTRGWDSTHNYGVRLTPDKRQWALSGGTMAGQQSFGAAPYPGQMGLPAAAWSAIGSLTGAAATAGVMGMQASTGDISWRIQRMDGWKAQGQHPVPNIPVPESRLRTSRQIEMASPYYSSVLGDMFANFTMTFKYDGTGVGGILVDATPSTADNVGGGLSVEMQIVPLSESFPSQTARGQQVACVELRVFYTFQWTISDSDLVVVTYRLYGDGTYESNVRGGQSSLSQVPATYSDIRR